MATLETSPEANSNRQADGRQADRGKKPLIGARATALPKNEEELKNENDQNTRTN